MITVIKGTLSQVLEDRVCVDVNGLGYDVYIPNVFLRSFADKLDQPVTLFTYHYLEGSPGGGNLIPMLVGFPTEFDREFFVKLTTVKNLGVRKVLRAMAASTANLAAAIEERDLAALTKMPEIGRRTAEQIVAELNGKVGKFALMHEPEAPAETPAQDRLRREALEVLLQLGYRLAQAEEMLEAALEEAGEDVAVEELIQLIYRRREGE
jgi:Holliday junction DNA helicase RuvA